MKAAVLLDEFASALQQLEQALAVQHVVDLEKAGCIHYFEFCFELGWKSIQALLEYSGLPACNSPRSCCKQAFSMGWIDNETIWLDMLSARNRMTHTYDHSKATETYDVLPGFFKALQELQQTLRYVLQTP